MAVMTKYVSEIFGTMTGLGVAGLLFLTWPEKPFLIVNDMRVVENDVIVSRTIPGPKAVADWRVTVVPRNGEAPVCQTVPGPELHQGWSVYPPSESQERVFTLDVWVGQDGCFESLPPGLYDMFVTWTPRDSRSPVSVHREFTVGT